MSDNVTAHNDVCKSISNIYRSLAYGAFAVGVFEPLTVDGTFDPLEMFSFFVVAFILTVVSLLPLYCQVDSQ